MTVEAAERTPVHLFRTPISLFRRLQGRLLAAEKAALFPQPSVMGLPRTAKELLEGIEGVVKTDSVVSGDLCVQKEDQHGPLATLAREEQAAKPPVLGTLGELLNAIDTGEVIIPYLKSPVLVNLAISTPPPVLDEKTGYLDYPVFTQREDHLRIFGIPATIEAIGLSFKTFASYKKNQVGLALIGPTGTGKNYLAEVIADAVEKKAAEIGTLYGAKDCPIKENALNVLGPKTKARLREKGIEVTDKPCTTCAKKYKGVDILDVPIEKLEFLADSGEQSGTLKPEETRLMDHQGAAAIREGIKAANGGIYVFDELKDHPEAFLAATKDIVRGGVLKDGIRTYRLDITFLTHTTYKEWQTFQTNDKYKPFVERWKVVLVPYNTSTDYEQQIYAQEVEPAADALGSHISPRALEFAAEFGVRTRLKDSKKVEDKLALLIDNWSDTKVWTIEKKKDAALRTKLQLYNGEPIAGFTTADRREIETEGLTKGEGLDTGMSPIEVRRLLMEALTATPECLSPINIYNFILRQNERAVNLSDEERTARRNALVAVRVDYEKWLEEIVRKSFRSGFDENVNNKRNEYFDVLDPWLEKKLVHNSSSGEDEEPNTLTLIQIESEIFGRELTRKERGDLFQGVRPDMKDKPKLYVQFEEGIRNIVLKAGSFQPEDVLSKLIRKEDGSLAVGDAKMEAEYNLAWGRLIEQGFCRHCIPEAMEYVARLVKPKQAAVNPQVAA